MNTYTVVGIYTDRLHETDIRSASFVHSVRAQTPTVGARKAKREMVESGKLKDADTIKIVAVFEGDHRDHYEPQLDDEEYERSVCNDAH